MQFDSTDINVAAEARIFSNGNNRRSFSQQSHLLMGEPRRNELVSTEPRELSDGKGIPKVLSAHKHSRILSQSIVNDDFGIESSANSPFPKRQNIELASHDGVLGSS